MTTTAGRHPNLSSGYTYLAEVSKATAYIRMYCVLLQHKIIKPSISFDSILNSPHDNIFFFELGDDFYCSVGGIQYRHDNNQVIAPNGAILSIELD